MARKLYATAFPLVDITVVSGRRDYAAPTDALLELIQNTSASVI